MNGRNYNLDIYLYAKGWYQKSDIVSDLKKIYSLRNGVDEEHINIRNIINCMGKLVYKHLSVRNSEYDFIEFIFNLGPLDACKTKRYDGEYDYYKQVISKFISILSMVHVDEIPEIKDFKPSEDVLPLSEGD